ncbi:MAG: DUF4430 domain-containing protein [Patescibacteria group bacterium]
MKKIFKSLTFPAISILVILIIYGALSLKNLEKTSLAAGKNNSLDDQKIVQLESTLNQYQNKLNEVIAANNELTQKVLTLKTSAQPQVIKTIQSQPEKIIETQTVTQIVNHEVEKNEATVTIQNVGSYKVALESGDNAFSILKRAATEHGFPLTYDTYSFGVFITGIGGIVPSGNQFWSFYYNGTFSNVGASDQPVKKGDNTFWQLSTF